LFIESILFLIARPQRAYARNKNGERSEEKAERQSGERGGGREGGRKARWCKKKTPPCEGRGAHSRRHPFAKLLTTGNARRGAERKEGRKEEKRTRGQHG